MVLVEEPKVSADSVRDNLAIPVSDEALAKYQSLIQGLALSSPVWTFISNLYIVSIIYLLVLKSTLLFL